MQAGECVQRAARIEAAVGGIEQKHHGCTREDREAKRQHRDRSPAFAARLDDRRHGVRRGRRCGVGEFRVHGSVFSSTGGGPAQQAEYGGDADGEHEDAQEERDDGADESGHGHGFALLRGVFLQLREGDGRKDNAQNIEQYRAAHDEHAPHAATAAAERKHREDAADHPGEGEFVGRGGLWGACGGDRRRECSGEFG